MSSKFPIGVATRYRPRFMCVGLQLHASSLARGGVCRACYTAVFKTQAEETALPLYEYQCLKCGKKTEKIESVSGPHLKNCPHLRRQSRAAAVRSSDSVQRFGVVCNGLRGKISKSAAGTAGHRILPRVRSRQVRKADKPEKKDPSAKESSTKESGSKERKETKPASKKIVIRTLSRN